MSFEDEQAVGLLLEETKSLVRGDYEEMEKAALSAVEAAESLQPRVVELEFEAHFYLSVSYLMQDKFSLAFSTAARVITMSETEMLDLGSKEKFIAMSYTCCAVSAVELPSVQKEALQISKRGIKRSERMGMDGLLYLKHEHSKLLMHNKEFTEAVAYAEKLVMERKLASENETACDLDCYQRVYAESLALDSSPEAGIRYLDEAIEEDPDSIKLRHMRAKLKFRAGDYNAVLDDCHAAKLIEDDNNEVLLLSAFASALQYEMCYAADDLKKLLNIDSKNRTNVLWYSLFASKKKRLKRIAEDDGWESQIARYLLSEISFDELCELSKKEENPETSFGESCCLSGLHFAMKNDQKQASHFYEQCLDHSHFLSDSYMWADASLKRIEIEP